MLDGRWQYQNDNEENWVYSVIIEASSVHEFTVESSRREHRLNAYWHNRLSQVSEVTHSATVLSPI